MWSSRGRLTPLAAARGSVHLAGKQSVPLFSQGDSVNRLAAVTILDDRLDIQLNDMALGVLSTAMLKGRSTAILRVG